MSAIGRKTGRGRAERDDIDPGVPGVCRQRPARKEAELWHHDAHMLRAALSSVVVPTAMSHLMYAQARLCAPVLGDASAQLFRLPRYLLPPVCAIAVGCFFAHRYRKLSWRVALRYTSLLLALNLLYISLIVSTWTRPPPLVQNGLILLAMFCTSCSFVARPVRSCVRVEGSVTDDAHPRTETADSGCSSALSQSAYTAFPADLLRGDSYQSSASRTSSTPWITSFRPYRQ